MRYCCEQLKESQGKGRFTVTGVRWAESSNRKNNQGVITIPGAGKHIKNALEEAGIDYLQTVRGGAVLNYDDDPDRRMSEFCMRTGKALLNPIIDWTDEDVWNFLNSNNIPHCCLYDEGFKRLGCIGCPMSRPVRMRKELERWPKYKEAYLRTFAKLIELRKKDGIPCSWETAEDVMEWWLSGNT